MLPVNLCPKVITFSGYHCILSDFVNHYKSNSVNPFFTNYVNPSSFQAPMHLSVNQRRGRATSKIDCKLKIIVGKCVNKTFQVDCKLKVSAKDVTTTSRKKE